MAYGYVFFFLESDGDPRDLHNLRHSFPTRRSSDLSKAVIGPAPERPPIKRSQLVATSLANGVTAPSPVITTLWHPLAPISPPDPQSAIGEEHLAPDDQEATREQRLPPPVSA